MARIVIKDLHESTQLDQKAMKNIRGGARGSIGLAQRRSHATQGRQNLLQRFFSNK